MTIEEQEGKVERQDEEQRRLRMEIFLKKVNLPFEWQSLYFKQAYIRSVEVDRIRKTWFIHLVLDKLLPREVYQSFRQALHAELASLANIQLHLHFSSEVSDAEVVAMYWPLFVEQLPPKLHLGHAGLAKVKVSYNSGLIHIYLSTSLNFERFRIKEIGQSASDYFWHHFSRKYQIKWELQEQKENQYEKFAQRIEDESAQAVQQLMAEPTNQDFTQKQPKTTFPVFVGNEIKEPPLLLSDIPDEEAKIVVKGVVFNLEIKELRTGSTLFSFAITDFTDSLAVKLFCKTKENYRQLSTLGNGQWVKVKGKVGFDRFNTPPELLLFANDVQAVAAPIQTMDSAPKKRVEFHLHTTMSIMDAVTPIEDYIKTAVQWGHTALAITDHANVQSFPDAAKAAAKYGIKVLYGVEANLVNDETKIVFGTGNQALNETEYVIFDIETTGLSVTRNKIIELAAIKIKNQEEIARFETLINPHQPIPANIQQLTQITNEMVKDAAELSDKLPDFLSFAKDAVLVAHNARFDMGFIHMACEMLNLPKLINPVIDTLGLARYLHPRLKNHRLNTLAALYHVPLNNHHRAIEDTVALGGILTGLLKELEKQKVSHLNELNGLTRGNWKISRPTHCGIYALNERGKKNLYRLISSSHTETFQRVACIPKQKLTAHREGLLVISGCDKGELFEAVLNKSEEEAISVAQFYDVLEIQPQDFYLHLVDKGLVINKTQIKEVLQKIVNIGEKLKKPVIATGNVHYLKPQDKIFREITIHGITGFSPLKDQRKPDAHFRTTDEMLAEFNFLGKEKAYEVVVSNTEALAKRFAALCLFPDRLFTPKIDGADEEIRSTCYTTARALYGEQLPEVIVTRLEKELVPIIKYGFSANYLISERLVKKSNEDGYLVGSRGSVGSSIVATFLGISEVNPLSPHYLCTNLSCRHSEWFLDGKIRSGFDLEDKLCPKCDAIMRGDGHDIPFETFLGFKGDKIPDIDLNFSGAYQSVAHHYTKELFGEKNVFRAGTISSVADKTAYGYTKKYEEDHHKIWRGVERSRLANGCTGVKRSTGQHPGGIVVVPDDMEIEDITPVQFPADDMKSEWKTTHFDFHAFDENLLKLDILGHDDPTMVRMLQDLTHVDPSTIPMNDPQVMSLFRCVSALGVTPEQIRTSVATYGLPEMGTRFVRQMLEETKPTTFADLLQISGLSHGTGVWLGNAQELIRNQICTIKTVIGCRDDIMLYLIYKAGMKDALAFKITESVRKGRGLTPEWIKEMKACQVPQWYIDSCMKIEYMFPKAHAAAYVVAAVRAAYFKLYYPIAFYAAFFSVRAADFDIELFSQGYPTILKMLQEIEDKGFEASAKEKGMIPILEMGLEMTARGFTFKSLDLYRSEAKQFIVHEESLIPPFGALAGVGENTAQQLASARQGGEFLSVEDFQYRSKASKTTIEALIKLGAFRGLPETNQLLMF